MPEEAPQPVHYDRLDGLVHVAIGEASMCWRPMPQGVFNDLMAARLAEQLLHDIRALYGIVQP